MSINWGGRYEQKKICVYKYVCFIGGAFSVAINVDADILLIDEILAVGDQHFQDKCFKKLEELRDSSKTIVIVTHSLDSVKKLCNRAIWIKDGNVCMDGKVEEVVEKYLKEC